MKIAFFDSAPWQKPYFSDAFPNDELLFYTHPLNNAVDPEVIDADIISVFVCSHVTKEILDQFSQLKLICTRSTGFDHVDISAAKDKQIVVCNVPLYATTSVAEYTFALLLTLSRKIYIAYRRVRMEHSFSVENLQGFDLHGKTLGVVGVGNIGKQVIRVASGFGMNIIAYDSFQDAAFSKKYNFSYISFEELLLKSDVITLHVPLNKETRHLIDLAAIKQMKKGVYIINTARGEIVDTKALIQGLNDQIVAGAGLDVLQEERFTADPVSLLIEDHPHKKEAENVMRNNYLIDHPQVIVTPHNAFNTRQAVERLTFETIKTINAWREGKPICQVLPADSHT